SNNHTPLWSVSVRYVPLVSPKPSRRISAACFVGWYRRTVLILLIAPGPSILLLTAVRNVKRAPPAQTFALPRPPSATEIASPAQHQPLGNGLPSRLAPARQAPPISLGEAELDISLSSLLGHIHAKFGIQPASGLAHGT